MRQLSRNDLRHPVNRRFREEAPLGARIADRVTTFLGSWTFLVIQTAIVIAWIAGNIVLLFDFDPFPFILLNLAFSTQAAYAAPLILLAGNRQSLRDRMTLEHAASEADLEPVADQDARYLAERLQPVHREAQLDLRRRRAVEPLRERVDRPQADEDHQGRDGRDDVLPCPGGHAHG